MAAMVGTEEKGQFRFIKSELSGYCLQVEDTIAADLPQRPVCLAAIIPNKLCQLWRVNADHSIQNAEGRYLDLSGLGGKGSSVCASAKTDSITQQWHMTPDGELVNDNGMYLTIKGGKKTAAATVWANTRKKSPAQKWVLQDDVNLDELKLEKLRERLNVALVLAAMKTAVKNEDLSTLFQQFDLDHNGTLDENEIKTLVRDKNAMNVSEDELSDLELKAFIKEIDSNGDGLIDFSEFTEFLGFKEHVVEPVKDEEDEEEGEESDDDEDEESEEDESEEEEPPQASTVKFSSGTKKK